jgi:osmoprotectant transport system substrate-binding protein
MLVVGTIALAGCGGGDDGGTDEPAGTDDAAASSLDGASLAVGSKDFAEQIILSQMAIQLLEQAGASVDDNTNIVGSANTRTALESGDIDLYWEYTGTGWITYLGETEPIADPQEQFEAVRDADLEQNRIVWLDPAPLNNTYAFAIRREKAEELGVETLSDVAALVASNPEEATFCIESEFSTRDDGWPGLQEAYGMEVPEDNVALLDTGLIYTETDKGETCNFGEVFATDGRISALDLVVMEDDLSFFPVYQAAVTLKQETLDEYPEIADIMNPVAAELTDEVMQSLNAQVDVDGEDPADVAQAWLQENGFLQ